MTADDKRLFRSLEQQHADGSLSRSNSLVEGVSPANGSPSSPFGDLTDHQTRKKLVHLIATLNASYPDYDFSTAKAESFTWKTGAECARMPFHSFRLPVGAPFPPFRRDSSTCSGARMGASTGCPALAAAVRLRAAALHAPPPA